MVHQLWERHKTSQKVAWVTKVAWVCRIERMLEAHIISTNFE